MELGEGCGGAHRVGLTGWGGVELGEGRGGAHRVGRGGAGRGGKRSLGGRWNWVRGSKGQSEAGLG